MMLQRIRDAIEFLAATGVRPDHALRTIEFYTSHEGLLLDYEEAQTDSHREAWYNVGAHLLWIGDRTRQLDGAHIDYFRGIRNPLGVKVGPTMRDDELVTLVKTLDPDNEPGRLVLITRYGSERIRDHLPGHVEALKRAGLGVVWACDPMHGNTTKTEGGYKTRECDRILAELQSAFSIHAELGGHLGGVHFELTGEDVTECIGGPQKLQESDLSRDYATYCDPRLNYAQSIEMAFLMAKRLRRHQT